MQKLLEDIVKSIVDKPDEVKVNINESENTIVYELNVGDGDLGKVNGKYININLNESVCNIMTICNIYDTKH